MRVNVILRLLSGIVIIMKSRSPGFQSDNALFIRSDYRDNLIICDVIRVRTRHVETYNRRNPVRLLFDRIYSLNNKFTTTLFDRIEYRVRSNNRNVRARGKKPSFTMYIRGETAAMKYYHRCTSKHKTPG